MDEKTVSIVMYGENDERDFRWLDWYEDAKLIMKLLGYEYNYVGVESKNLNPGKIRTSKRYEKKIIDEIKNRQKISYISMYSLPKKFQSASFDYDIMILRNSQFIIITINKSDLNKIEEVKLIELMEKYLQNSYGEIYEMDKSEVPLMYAYKVNSLSSFKSLKIIRKIN